MLTNKADVQIPDDKKWMIPITEAQLNGGEDWVKAHKGTDIVDTPLWVFISLGIKALQREAKKEEKKDEV